MQSEHDAYFTIKKSQDDYLVVFESFTDKDLLETAFKEIQKFYLGAYHNLITTKDIKIEGEITVPVLRSIKKNTDKLAIVSKNITSKAEKKVESEVVEVKINNDSVIKSIKEKKSIDSSIENAEYNASKIEKIVESKKIKIEGKNNMNEIEEFFHILILVVLIAYVLMFYLFSRDKEKILEDIEPIEDFPFVVEEDIPFVPENVNVKPVKHLRVKQESYADMIEDFIYNHHFSIERIKDMMASHEYEGVYELVTNIKKSAGRIGAKDLLKSASLVQRDLKDKKIEKSSLKMDDFYRTIASTLEEVNSYKEE